MERAAIFCQTGLGDGVISLILANNLKLNGISVDTFHNTMGSMQSWFPHLPIKPYPSADELESIFQRYDLFFVFHNRTCSFVLKLIEEGKRRFPDRVKVIYIYPSKNIVNEPYYLDSQIDPMISIAENLRRFCEHVLRLPKISRGNGCIPPPELRHHAHPKRIVFHPTGSRLSKNWPKDRYLALARKLREEGYQIAWALPAEDHAEWPELIEEDYDIINGSLDFLARTLYESGYFIGNDSGPGHLASSLGIPTVTIARRKAYSRFWAPDFTKRAIVNPSSLIPNIRGFRLRDRYWRHFISVAKVLYAFEQLRTC